MTTTSSTKDMTTTEYSKYSYVIRGKGTKAIKEKLKSANCKWNTHLKGGAGWIVSKKSFKKVQSFVPVPTDVKKPVTVVDEDSDSDSDSDSESEIDYKALYEKEQEDHRCSKMGFKIHSKSVRRMNKEKIKKLQDKMISDKYLDHMGLPYMNSRYHRVMGFVMGFWHDHDIHPNERELARCVGFLNNRDDIILQAGYDDDWMEHMNNLGYDDCTRCHHYHNHHTGSCVGVINETVVSEDKAEIMEVMSDLDGKKETIQEGLYLKLSNLLMKFYNK